MKSTEYSFSLKSSGTTVSPLGVVRGRWRPPHLILYAVGEFKLAHHLANRASTSYIH